MMWPFRKKPQAKGLLTKGSTQDMKDPFYFARPQIEKLLTNALSQSNSLVIYGPSHQGKTTLLTRHRTPADSIYVECRPGFKRTQIYRVVLSSLGYAVLTEKTKRGKATTTVKFGVTALGGEASAEEELDQTMQAITIDLKNPSEVATPNSVATSDQCDLASHISFSHTLQLPFPDHVHHLRKIAMAQRISEIPSSAEQNDVGLKMTPFERVSFAHDKSSFVRFSQLYQISFLLATQPFNQSGRVTVAEAGSHRQYISMRWYWDQ